jgi:V/A-type H+-transporting ATPase subunit A
LSGAEGSVTLISAISPPGGDFSEPVTRHTQRFAQCFWTLDKTLAEARMFPAVSLHESYSHLPDALVSWWHAATSPEWAAERQAALGLLTDAARAEATARLVGTETLPERQQWLIETARLFEDGFLRQNAFDSTDAYCSPLRQYRLLELLLHTYRRGLAALGRGVTARALAALGVMTRVSRAKSDIDDRSLAAFDGLKEAIDADCASLEQQVAGHALAAKAERADG